MLKTVGGMVPGAVRESLRKRAVRRTVKGLTERVPTDVVVDRLSADELSRLVSYVRLPDFEQLAIQLTGLTLERKRPAKLEAIHSFSSVVRSQVTKIEGHVRPPHINSGQRVPLSGLDVERPLVPNTPDEVLQPTARLSPKVVMAQHLRTGVLGDPGGGKSTLAAKLAVDLARSSQSRGVVPFLVVMREFVQRFERDQLSVAHYLRTLASGRYQVETTTDCIEFLLLNGRAVVIFDGLDELLDTSLRRQDSTLASETRKELTEAFPAGG